MKNKASSMIIYSICHFIVDFVCAIFVLGKLVPIAESMQDAIMAAIVYNFFAFAFQVPLGYILDKFKVYKYVAIIGMGLIGITYFISSKNIIALASVVGIGNALFHLEGGVNAYAISKGKAFINGLFVAPGALGIFLGTMFNEELIVSYVPIALITISIMLLFLIQTQDVNKELTKINSRNISIKSCILIVLLIGVSIIVRSIGGSAIVYTWKTGFVLGFTYTLAIVLGKAIGGLVADKFGLLKVACISLLLSAVCLVLGHNYHMLAYVGIFLFNIPMSITLTILENTLTKKIACAVGLNTMFLFIGYIICFIDMTIDNNFVLVGSIILAVLSIYFADKLYVRGGALNEKN